MEVKLGKAYIPDLLKRLKRAKISHKSLSRAVGMDPAQFSRYANRHIEPNVGTILKIERGIAKILKQRARLAARQSSQGASMPE